MAPSQGKRPIEVLVLSDSEDEDVPKPKKVANKPLSSQSDVGGGGGWDDEEMKKAMELPIEEPSGSDSHSQKRSEPGHKASTSSAISTSTSRPVQESREELEKARLARQAARLAEGSSIASAYKVQPAVSRPTVQTITSIGGSITGDPTQPQSTSTSTGAVASSSSSSVHGFSSLASSSKSTSSGSASSSSGSSNITNSTRFFSGSLKRVTNLYVPDRDSLSFDAVLGPKASLKYAIVSAYVVDVEWTISHFPPNVPLLLVMPHDDKQKGSGILEVMPPEIRPDTYRVAPVARSGMSDFVGAMHTKLTILYYHDFCRVVIPTANQVDYDWDRIDNAMYIQDFPLRFKAEEDKVSPLHNPTHTNFSRDLLKALKSHSVPKKFAAGFSMYDFSSSADVQLVVSIQGPAWGWEDVEKMGGISSLANAVKACKFSKGGRWEIEATGSSLGQASENWLNNMMAACAGVHPESYLGPKQKQSKDFPSGHKCPIKIVYPTLDEVDNSHGGRPGGGTMFFQEKMWHSNNFPKHLLYRGQSKRKGVIAHTKTIVAIKRPGKSDDPNYRPEAWIYVGSHNFTKSAWGEMIWSHTGRGPGITIGNYEMGCLIPVRGKTIEEVERKVNEMVTFKRPLEKYSSSDEPWMQSLYL
ncbi:phospholipase D/nuclease [Meredithblackwellia eburnea MCA 4105]